MLNVTDGSFACKFFWQLSQIVALFHFCSCDDGGGNGNKYHDPDYNYKFSLTHNFPFEALPIPHRLLLMHSLMVLQRFRVGAIKNLSGVNRFFGGAVGHHDKFAALQCRLVFHNSVLVYAQAVESSTQHT